MWVLVVVFLYNSPAMATVPGYYSTKEKCEEAAAVATVPGLFERTKAYCIPAPDGLGFE